MNLITLKQILEVTGYPVAYSHFTPTEEEPVPEPPYICYLVSYTSNFKADNKVYKRVDNVQIELYTLKKDLTAEAKIESVFEEYEIPWDSTEMFIESEKLYQKIYETRLI